MICHRLRWLLLAAMIIAEPCLATADTTPKKSPPKVVPQVPQSPTPTKRSSKLYQYRSLNTYHPHQGKGGAGHSKRNPPGKA